MNIETLLQCNDSKKTLGPHRLRFKCPSCGEQNYKLYVDLEKKRYTCYKCGLKGRLNNELPTSLDHFTNKVKEFKNGKQSREISSSIRLPKEIISPIREDSGLPFKYLRRRGLSSGEIKRYNFGYCSNGDFRERVILPIYDNGDLVYYIGRAYTQNKLRYLNHGTGRSRVIFKTFTGKVDFCVLVEGAFTAIYVGRIFPAVATLGKVVTETQAKKIGECTKRVYVMLDENAKKENMQATVKLSHYVEVIPIFINAKAPDDLSYKDLEYLIQERTI